MLRLLHSADWQIGRVYSQFEPDDAAALAAARFKAVERLAGLANAHRADAVVVAGDVFDAQTVSDKTLRRLFNAMQAFTGPWLLLPGNHDAALSESVWTRALRLNVVPPNVAACLEAKPRVVGDAFALLPAPLTQRHTHEDLTAWFASAATPDGLPRIGLAHGCVQGVLPEDIDSANPIAADRALSAGLDYLALGDWHGTRRIDARTWYSGTPETDRFKANDSGQALLVTIAAPGALPQVRALPTGEYRWQQWEHRIAVPSDVAEVLRALSAVGGGDVVQLGLAGSSDLADHRRLRQGVEAARAHARALVCDDSGLQLEPTEEDLRALRADGYVGEVIAELRAQQHGADAGLARDALLELARVLDDAARAGGSAA
jgi:DNA repair exonuclease SbcCD nuclease subunit